MAWCQLILSREWFNSIPSLFQGAVGPNGTLHYHPTAALSPSSAGRLLVGGPAARQVGRLQKEEHPHASKFTGYSESRHCQDRPARPQQCQVLFTFFYYYVNGQELGKHLLCKSWLTVTDFFFTDFFPPVFSLEHLTCAAVPRAPVDPCSRESVLKVLKDSRKREVDDADRSFNAEQRSKRR